MKSVITVVCPECQGTLEIDTARQRVLSHKAKLRKGVNDEEKDKSQLFDEVVERVKNKRSDAEDRFEAAHREAKQNRERLDNLFGEFQEKLEEEKKKDPSDDEVNPRDLFWD